MRIVLFIVLFQKQTELRSVYLKVGTFQEFGESEGRRGIGSVGEVGEGVVCLDCSDRVLWGWRWADALGM